MEPESNKRPAVDSDFRRRPSRPNTGLVLGTGVVLVLAFIIIILLFFALSSFSPAIVGKCVAEVDIDQPLAVDGTPQSILGGSGSPGSEDIANAIKSINKRDDVGAVLFVINSPGGSVVATHDIYNAVKSLNKPSVSYFREEAASGAYYVASGTNYIVADPDTLTGSIGVITEVTSMEGLLDKLGVNVTAIKSGQYKDIGSPYRNMTDNETVIMQALINEVYQEFRDVVITNRGSRLNIAKFDAIADGRVLSGRQALDVGLVDQLGTKDDALIKAASLGNITYDTADDIRICPIDTSTANSGLFSFQAFVKALETQSSTPTLSFK